MRTNGVTPVKTEKMAYPDQRKPATNKVNYPFVNTREGRTVKITAILLGDELAGVAEASNRQFRPTGLFAKGLTEAVVRLHPWFPAEYERVTGLVLKSNILYNRWHKSSKYWTRKKGLSLIGGQSIEHPQNSRKLRPCLEAVERLIKRGTPTTIEEARKAGTPK